MTAPVPYLSDCLCALYTLQSSPCIHILQAYSTLYIQIESIHIYVCVHVAGILYTTYTFCTLNFRVMSTFRVSGDGQALFMPSESEMQRLCVPKKDRYCTFFLLFIHI